MHMSSKECDDEEGKRQKYRNISRDDFKNTPTTLASLVSPSSSTTKISSLKSHKKSTFISCGLKRKLLNDIYEKDIPTKTKANLTELPSVSSTKLNNQECVVKLNQTKNISKNYDNKNEDLIKDTRKIKCQQIFSDSASLLSPKLLNKKEENIEKEQNNNNIENKSKNIRKFFKTPNRKVEIRTVWNQFSLEQKQQTLKLQLQTFEEQSAKIKLNKKRNLKKQNPKKSSNRNNKNNVNNSNSNRVRENCQESKSISLSTSSSTPLLSSPIDENNSLSNNFVEEDKENQLLIFSPIREIKSSENSKLATTRTITKRNKKQFNTSRNNFKTPLLPLKKKTLIGKSIGIIDLVELEASRPEFQQKTSERKDISHENNKNLQQKPSNVLDLNEDYNFFNTKKPRLDSFNNNSRNMSMYDRRIQADNKSINGYVSGTSGNRIHHHHHNNDDSVSTTTSTTATAIHLSNSNIMNNHCYQCPPPPLPPVSHSTMATLCNIGNTCYLNSVIYTLRSAPKFLHNLHHLVDDLSNIQKNLNRHHIKSSSLGRNITGIHMENTRSWSSKDLASLESISCDMPKSNQQIATEKLHELYQSLHRNECTETAEPFHADTFLHAIQDVSAIFEGNQQQDAHEFLMCVLDSIRETCQALIKAVSECPEVVINGCISLPEERECNVTIPKEKSLQRDTSSAIIKTSFFSRKSKRKEQEMKILKNNSNISTSSGNSNPIQSPHKDNTQHHHSRSHQPTSSSSDISSTVDGINSSNSNISGGNTLNGSKLSLKSDIDVTTKNIKDNKERLSDKIKKLGFDFFSEDFEGITVSTTKCLSCETITEQKETMIDIAVPITGYENTNLGNKFIQDSCVTKEYFRGENKYRCEQCMGYTEAIRSISYEVLPRLLVIQLSRFSGVMEKINTYVPTPFTLQCFCSKCLELSSSPSTSTLSSSLSLNDNKNLHVYKLYSVITHVGATMSVGHYIAYTCSLDWANDYINCPKDCVRQAQIMKQQSVNNTGSGSNSILNGPEKNVRQIKKMIFGRSKTSSSSDMSKTVKNINGLSSSTKISNNISSSSTGNNDKQQQQQNIICPSINCCGLHLRNNLLLSNSNYNSNSNSNGSGNSIGGFYNMDIDDSPSSVYTLNNYSNSNSSGYGTSTQNQHQNLNNACRNRNSQQQQNEPIWYMCDDDKIKAMSQREFEDMLSPNRKNMITPYLLFYARNNLQ